MAPTSRYRVPSKAPVTRWARHIDRWMRQENLSQTAAFRRLRAAVGLGEESRSAFLPYLLDKEPREHEAAALAAIIGWPPEELEPETQQPGPSMDAARLFDAFAQALEVQARYLTQIEDLRTEMAEARRTAEEGREEQARLIGHLSDQLDELRVLVGTPAGSGSRGSAGRD